MNKPSPNSFIKKYHLRFHAPSDGSDGDHILCEFESEEPFQAARQGDILDLRKYDGNPLGDLLEIVKIQRSLFIGENGGVDSESTDVFTKIFQTDLKNNDTDRPRNSIEIDLENKSLADAVSELEKKMVLAAHTNFKENISATARHLGITRKQLYLKLEGYKLINIFSRK